MARVVTLAGHALNDGTTYSIDGEIVAEELGVSFTIVDNASDGSQQQVNVKTKVPSNIAFALIVQSTTSALLNTAWSNLVAWVKAGGAFVVIDNGTTVLSCTCGASTPPVRHYGGSDYFKFWTATTVELVRLT